jgi:hypothetical protein
VRDGHHAKFCFRRKREERFAKEMANKDRYHPSRGVPEHRMVPRGEGVVYTVPRQVRREFVPRGVPQQRNGGRCVGFDRGEFVGHSFTCCQYERGGNNHSFKSQRSYEDGLHFVLRIVLQGDVWVFHLGEIGRILLNPLLSKWHSTSLIHFVLTPVLSCLLSHALIFYFAGGRHGGLLVNPLQ